MQNLNFNGFILKVCFGLVLMCSFSFLNYFLDIKFLTGLFSLYALDESRQIYKSTKRAAEKIVSKYHLRTACIGRERNKDGQEVIEIGFDYYSKPLLIDEAREKLILFFQDFLSEINLDQKFQKAFTNSALKPENVNFYIINRDENHTQDILHPFIFIMEVDKGKVAFYSVKARFQRGYEEVIEETYEEALEKLQKQKTKNNPLGK